jgi:branched-subunit amino acid ABC-type transport system permease component
MINRPAKVKFVAFYLCAKAAALGGCVLSVHFWPDTLLAANGLIEGLVPFIGALRDPGADIWLAPLFALVDVTLGVGVWLLQRWARTLIVIDLTWLFGRALVGLAAVLIVFHGAVHFQNTSRYFTVNLMASLITLAFLLDSDVKRAFGLRD